MNMRKLLGQILALAAPIAFANLSVDASAQEQMHVTPIEIAQLPHFCWGRYKVPNAVGPEFNMPPPRECGVAMNHYCDGLIFVIRSQHATRKSERLSLLGRADQNIRYTESSIADHPQCPIREHVEQSRARVDELFIVYGGRPPKKKR
jgi:hypothetical protein